MFWVEKMIKKAFLVSLLIFSYVALSYDYLPYDQLISYYNENFKIIRVVIPEAPGFGHQAASITMMRRLRQLGYTGKFEIIFEDMGETASKVKKLIPSLLAADINEIELVKDPLLGKISVESNYSFSSRCRSKNCGVPFAITGAWDGAISAKDYHCQKLMTLQPFRWAQSTPALLRNMEVPTAEYHTRHAINHIGLSEFTFHPLPYDYSHLYKADYDFSLWNKLVSQKMKIEIEELKNIGRQLLEKPNIETMPLYGIDYFPGHQKKLQTIIESVDLAMSKSSGEMQSKTVLFFFHKLDAEKYSNLMDIKLSGGKKLNILHLADLAKLNMQELKSPLTLIEIGSVPQEVFEFFFANTSLPAALEGSNASMLSRNLGKPYIVTRNTYVQPTKSLFNNVVYPKEKYIFEAEIAGRPKLRRGFEHYSKIAKQMDELRFPNHEVTAELRELVADYLLTSKNPKSSLSRYFKTLQKFPMKNLKFDKLYQLLSVFHYTHSDCSVAIAPRKKLLELIRKNFSKAMK